MLVFKKLLFLRQRYGKSVNALCDIFRKKMITAEIALWHNFVRCRNVGKGFWYPYSD